MFRYFKLTQKIFFIFVLMIVLVMNSWAFTFTTVLDFQDSFTTVQQYSFPSVVLTSELKDDVHIALLAVYNYLATGETASKTIYQEKFTEAIRAEYALFQLSQTSTDFEFTQQFNEKLLAVYTQADELVTQYEQDPTDPGVRDKLATLNTARYDFITFTETEITNQISSQIDQANATISSTVQTIKLYLVGVSALVL